MSDKKYLTWKEFLKELDLRIGTTRYEHILKDYKFAILSNKKITIFIPHHKHPGNEEVEFIKTALLKIFKKDIKITKIDHANNCITIDNLNKINKSKDLELDVNYMKTFIQNQGWSEVMLAKELDLDYSYVYRVMRNQRGMGKKFILGLMRLCDKLKLDFQKFVIYE